MIRRASAACVLCAAARAIIEAPIGATQIAEGNAMSVAESRNAAATTTTTASVSSSRRTEDDEDTGEEETGEYEVESIVDTRMFKGEEQFRVHWRGYSPEEDTWEPTDNLGGCQELLLQFFRNRKALTYSTNESEVLSLKQDNKVDKKNEMVVETPGKSPKKKKKKKNRIRENAELRDKKSCTDATSAGGSKPSHKHHHKKHSKSKHHHSTSPAKSNLSKHSENVKPTNTTAVSEKQLSVYPIPENDKSNIFPSNDSNHDANSKTALEMQAACTVVKIERLSDNEEYFDSCQSSARDNNYPPDMGNVSVKVELDWEGSVTSDNASVADSGGMHKVCSQETVCQENLPVDGLISTASECVGVSAKSMKSEAITPRKRCVGSRKLVVSLDRLKSFNVEGSKSSAKSKIPASVECESVRAGVGRVPVKSPCGDKLGDSKCLSKKSLADKAVTPKNLKNDTTKLVESASDLHEKKRRHKHKPTTDISIVPKKKTKASSADAVCEKLTDVAQSALADEDLSATNSAEEHKPFLCVHGSSLWKLQESLNFDSVHDNDTSSSEESHHKEPGDNSPSESTAPSSDGATVDIKLQALMSLSTVPKQERLLSLDTKPCSSSLSLPKGRSREEIIFDCLKLEQLRRRLFEECLVAAAMAARDAAIGASVIGIGMGSLREAVRTGNLPAVKNVLSSRPHLLDHEDGTGMTLLMLAAAFGKLEIVRFLISIGANVNALQKNGITALMHTAEKNHITTLALLLENGAHVNLKQTNGETALSKACKLGNVEIVRLLLDNFVDYNAMLAQTQGPQKYFNNQIVSEMIASHSELLNSSVADVIREYFEEDVKLLGSVFPMVCHRLYDSRVCNVEFYYMPTKTPAGSRLLLFLVHTTAQGCERATYRLTGSCAVQAVILNHRYQLPIFQKNNFLFSLNLVLGLNSLVIRFNPSTALQDHVMVCARIMSLTD